MKAVVIGGGIMGTAIAHELAHHQVAVTVLERSVPGAEASTAAAGMLAPQLEASAPGPMLELCLRSRTLYPSWVEQLRLETGVDAAYLRSGALQLAFSEAEAHELDATVAWQQAFGLRGSLLSPHELRALEPGAASAAVAAAHFPDDHQVDPRRLMESLALAAKRRGVQFRSGTVRRLQLEHETVTGVELEDGVEHGDVIIVAAGAWTPLVQGAQIDPTHLRPARGQLIELAPATSPVRHILKSGRGYVVPRANERVICGTTVELVGYDKRVTTEGLAEVRAHATRLCPALREAPEVACWAGLRPWTDDGLPLLGPGARKGLLIASGHYRNGILLAPITARLVGQLVRGAPSSLELGPFAPARFG